MIAYQTRPRFSAGLAIFYIILILILLVVSFPILWMILGSLKTRLEILSVENLLFFTPTLGNFKDVFIKYDFLFPMFNSFFIAVISTVLALVLGVPASYAIARYKMNKLSIAILLARIIPGMIFLVPWFIIFTKLGIVDTYVSLILTHMLVSLPFGVWILVPIFEMLPIQLEEAACIDGSSRAGAFLRILLPLSSTGIITSAILSFVFSWNNFMFALILTGPKTKTLPIAIFSFVSYAEINWLGLMAAAVVITTPIIIISLVLQRYIISGLTAGAVKA